MLLKFNSGFQNLRSEVEFAVFIARLNYDAEKADKDLQLELTEIQWDSVLKQKLSEIFMPNLYLHVGKPPKIIQFESEIGLCVMFGSTKLIK
jgi:hypothetical protein